MVQFSVPVFKALSGKRFRRFSVTRNAVLLAGSIGMLKKLSFFNIPILKLPGFRVSFTEYNKIGL